MTRRARILCGLIPVLGLSGVSTALALTFQQDIGVSFTFNPSISVSLSSADLTIPNLTPGTVLDSNIITVNVKTNNASGYTVNATVGNDSTYNTRDLIHKNSLITNKFTSVNFGNTVSDKANLENNTWAYSYSTDNGTTWNDYSGLPLYSDETNIATLKASTGPVSTEGGDNIKFKIAAKASSDQASGEYNNVINFAAVATPTPKTLYMAYEDAGKTKLNGYFKLQDMNSNICNATEVLDEGSQMQAIDVRDNKVYWITKLQDGKCWFTQNLDLDLNSAKTFTHDDTDLGWGTSSTTSWTPVNNTIDASTVTNNVVSGWSNDNNVPYSVDPGNVYWTDTWYSSSSSIFLNNDFGRNPVKFRRNAPFTGNGAHGHVGNYYNWSAIVASNDSSVYSGPSTNPDDSLCPAGWRLPTVMNLGSSDPIVTEISNLQNYYSGTGDQALTAAPLYFVRAGRIVNSAQYNSGSWNLYWLSNVASNINAYNVQFNSNGINTEQSILNRYYGQSVRCIAR